ncbi:MAG: tetraacyldisaccharide 4'-kinase, partial [Bacteroidaceae bacterium]|nr:tetraacyldisaccharide 4'-kinase [Bacteroidaceae bacterium]
MRIYWSLFPLAWLYGCVVRLRNLCFDWGILKEHSFSVPVICIGNLTVGGTGKTPHTEYLIRLLKQQGKVAVLSRGYKRQTKGYLLADKTPIVSQIGDEPFQMKQKHPDILVAVDENRREGIQSLMALNP